MTRAVKRAILYIPATVRLAGVLSPYYCIVLVPPSRSFMESLTDFAMSKELSYYRLYLKKYLVDTDDPRKNVDDFIDSRAELAEREYEERRRDGLTVDQAQERAIAILMDGVE